MLKFIRFIGHPTLWRSVIVLSFSFVFITLPNYMPPILHVATTLLICVVFITVPDKQGIRSGLIAGVFSLVFTGLGHLYTREYGRAFFFILGGLFAYMLTGYKMQFILFNLVLFVVSAIDSFSFGKRGIGIF
ncbi:MAG: hypothetical protein ACE5FY_01405 [Nitrospiria bacterium]